MIELLRERRSVRAFTDQPIETEKVEALVEAVLRSPTSRNLNPWGFVFVDDKALLDGLSRCKPHGAGFLSSAKLAVVVCGDTKKSDVWIEDGSVASILLQMTAQSLGLGSCWVQVRNREHDGNVSSCQYVRKLLEVPDPYEVLSVIGIGYPDEHRPGVPMENLDQGKVHWNGWV